MVAPVGVVEVGTDKVIGLLHHRCRASALRRGTEHGKVEAVLVVDSLLDREEIAVGLVEGAFGVALSSITAAGGSHQIPAITHLARANGSHGAVVVGTVAESIAQRDLFTVLRGTGAVSRQATEAAEASSSLAETFDEEGVTEGIVEATPVGEDGASRLGVVHQDAVDHHVAVLRVVAAHTVAQRAQIVGRDAVEHVTRRVQQSGGVVDRGGGLVEVGVEQNHRRHVVLVQVGGVDDLGCKPRHHQYRNRQ